MVEKDAPEIDGIHAAEREMVTLPDAEPLTHIGRVILVGSDEETSLERRLRAAGGDVVKVKDGESAFERARREFFDGAVLVARGSLISVTETIFNLRDINPGMEIIVVVSGGGKNRTRYLKQLLSHPIAGTKVLTRRQLQERLQRGG